MLFLRFAARFILYVLQKKAYCLSCREHELARFKYKNDLRKERLSWYSDVIDKMIQLRHAIEINACDKIEMIRLIASLSGLIEVGRFFYPNVPSKHGEEKTKAYRGVRRAQLDLLVAFYDIARSDNADKYAYKLRKLEEHFTSLLFDDLKPIEHNEEAGEFVKMPESGKSFREMYEKEHPEMEKIFTLSHTCRKNPKTLQWCNRERP